MKYSLQFIAILCLSLLVSCADQRTHSQAIFMLVDTSGTYSQELDKAQRIVSYLLGTLKSGDTLAVARVKSRSFTEKDILAKATFVKDPMQVNTQKRAFIEKLGTFKAELKKGSAYTDITGGVIQAAEFLNETEAGQKTILIFSDMQEELDYKTVRDFPINLKGMRIIALNVTKLTTDNVDPRRYLGRLEWWEKRARTAGATDWQVVNDLEHLERIFKGRG
ncbi:MAG: VWA domain-containing protein [Gammaproteobacteria bacterium]|nr:VWA domain-containing protein [Gammaproteobacteria bacterium]